MMKSIYVLLALLCSAGFTYAQTLYTGIDADNYLGYANIHAQPAAIAGTCVKFGFTSSTGLFKISNYKAQNFNNFLGYLDNQPVKYREHHGGGFNHLHTSTDLLGLKYELNHKLAIGYGLRLRTFSLRDGLPGAWTRNDVFSYASNTAVLTPTAFKRLSFQSFNYMEHALQLARVMVDDGDRMIKLGLSLKLLNGLTAGYLHGREGNLQFDGSMGPNMTFLDGDMQFGSSNDPRELDQRRLGFGTSMGMVYEHRPDHKKFKYDMDGEKDIPRYDLPKYKWRLGVALTDLGFVRFTKDAVSHDYTNDSLPVQANGYLSPAGPINYTSIAVMPQVAPQRDKRKWNMTLPASFNLQFDYKIADQFYANYSTAIPLRIPGDPSGVHQKMIHSLTPRFESKRIGAAMPLSVQGNGQFNVGAAARVQVKGMTVFGGSNNITFLFGKRAIYNVSAFAGVTYNILYKVPKDRDLDKVSDAKDDCMYDPGAWEMHGCPDTDKDSIADKEDLCIYDKGTKKFRGCPDRDGDGIIDLNDQCPDQAGLAVHYGCPDKDFDGVIDVADRCPDVPGIELNNGCPFENRGCCSDNDGDGISNEVDACPEVQGSVYNKGCPIDSANIDKIPLQHMKDDLDPNHTITKVDEIPDTKRDAMMILSDREIAEAEKRFEQYSLNIYFEFDDATITEDAQSEIDDLVTSLAKSKKDVDYVIIGHTDFKGSENYNLILSRKRAEVVRRTLVNRGIPANRIKVYYYGEWQPLKSNDNARGRQFNRRVEVRVMKKQ